MKQLGLQGIFFLSLLFSSSLLAHSGSHGNDECLVTVGETELRLNGYQFKGSNPDRHYCWNFPHFGSTIIKVDAIKADLSDMAVELEFLRLDSWKAWLLNEEGAFKIIKQKPLQHFSKQVVSIGADIKETDIYAVNLRLHAAKGDISEQQFHFIVAFPFVQILVGISVVLLVFISIIFLRQLKRHG